MNVMLQHLQDHQQRVHTFQNLSVIIVQIVCKESGEDTLVNVYMWFHMFFGTLKIDLHTSQFSVFL